MDYLQEAIILGIDALIFGVCLNGYYSYRNTINALRVCLNYSLVLKMLAATDCGHPHKSFHFQIVRQQQQQKQYISCT